MSFQLVRDPITGLYTQKETDEAPTEPEVIEEWEEEIDEPVVVQKLPKKKVGK